MEDLMSEKTTMSTLKKSKKEVQTILHSLEIEIGHYLLKKPEKSLQKDVLTTYTSFNIDIDGLHATQENILNLVEERKTLQTEIVEQKKLVSTLCAQLPDIHKSLGQSLFLGYTAAYSDCFGSTYTQIAVQDQKIAAERKKESDIRNDLDNASFFPRIIKQVKAGVVKNQVNIYEEKRNELLLQGGKNASESKKLEKLLEESQLDNDSKNILTEYLKLQEIIDINQTTLETLTSTEKAVAADLSKNGANPFAQKRIQNIQKEVEQKKVEQNEFSATQGHEYACRYVSPDGEGIVEFPSDTAKNLSSIQKKRIAIVSLSRRIEILRLSQVIEDSENKSKSYARSVISNKEKITSLEHQNEELASKIKTTKSEQKMLVTKKGVLEDEEKVASTLTNVHKTDDEGI